MPEKIILNKQIIIVYISAAKKNLIVINIIINHNTIMAYGKGGKEII